MHTKLCKGRPHISSELEYDDPVLDGIFIKGIRNFFLVPTTYFQSIFNPPPPCFIHGKFRVTNFSSLCLIVILLEYRGI